MSLSIAIMLDHCLVHVAHSLKRESYCLADMTLNCPPSRNHFELLKLKLQIYGSLLNGKLIAAFVACGDITYKAARVVFGF